MRSLWFTASMGELHSENELLDKYGRYDNPVEVEVNIVKHRVCRRSPRHLGWQIGRAHV